MTETETRILIALLIVAAAYAGELRHAYAVAIERAENCEMGLAQERGLAQPESP